VASQVGKTLFRQQETQDVLALLRALSDSRDRLAFGALMRGPMVGLTDEELLDISEAIYQSEPEGSQGRFFDITTPPALVAHPIARSVLEKLQALRQRVNLTTPRILLAEAIEQLQMRVVLAARNGNNRAARSLANLDALIELARPFDVRGLRAFVRHLQADWERGASRLEGRIDASEDAVEIVTIHSAKGLEWSVVIPINMATLARSNERFVYRPSDNTLHWVIGNVSSSALTVAREELAHRQLLEDQRKWYVACTRARDLLIVPRLVAAKPGAWAKLLNLRFDLLGELQFNHLVPDPVAEPEKRSAVQDPRTFELQAEAIRAAAVPLRWVNPSADDSDRPELLAVPATVEPSSAIEYVEPIGAGRLRGLVLHKLMEELLTGELPESSDVAARAGQLVTELRAVISDAGEPDALEMAGTVLRTRNLPYVAQLWPTLMPEYAVWAQLESGALLAGRADAIAVSGDKIVEVLDWKSDRDATAHRAAHVHQMRRYLAAIGAPRGTIVYMTTLQVVAVTSDSTQLNEVMEA
jgi:ATP-dependent exoDNAse (exonuclease V) beta subunit